MKTAHQPVLTYHNSPVCGQCLKRSERCSYDCEEGETRQQGLNRRNNESAGRLRDLEGQYGKVTEENSDIRRQNRILSGALQLLITAAVDDPACLDYEVRRQLSSLLHCQSSDAERCLHVLKDALITRRDSNAGPQLAPFRGVDSASPRPNVPMVYPPLAIRPAYNSPSVGQSYTLPQAAFQRPKG